MMMLFSLGRCSCEEPQKKMMMSPPSWHASRDCVFVINGIKRWLINTAATSGNDGHCVTVINSIKRWLSIVMLYLPPLVCGGDCTCMTPVVPR